MDHDENRIDQDYVRGFNEGYVVMQYQPRLARSLMMVKSEAERMKGFRHGCHWRFLEENMEKSRRRMALLREHEQKTKTQARRGEAEDHGE